MRRSTVLSLPLQLVLPDIYVYGSLSVDIET
jgi:hypothetical protein